MSEDDLKYLYFEISGEKELNDELALSILLKEGVLFANSRKYYCDISKKLEPETIVLFLLCNDIFAWGCADAEEITTAELPKLMELYLANPECGPTQWVCLKRNQQPQKPIKEWLKNKNAWTEELEKLPENNYDNLIKDR